MQQVEPDEDELFDANLYSEGQERDVGLSYKAQTYLEIQQAAIEQNLNIIPNDKEKFLEILLKEQEVRLDKNIQDLYKKLNYNGDVEELIHGEIFKFFGYDDCILNHQLYYMFTRKYIKDPQMKKQIFFWRNNVMHGSRIQLNEMPPNIQLFTLNDELINLEDLLKLCHEQKRLLIAFAGSIT